MSIPKRKASNLSQTHIYQANKLRRTDSAYNHHSSTNTGENAERVDTRVPFLDYMDKYTSARCVEETTSCTAIMDNRYYIPATSNVVTRSRSSLIVRQEQHAPSSREQMNSLTLLTASSADCMESDLKNRESHISVNSEPRSIQGTASILADERLIKIPIMKTRKDLTCEDSTSG